MADTYDIENDMVSVKLILPDGEVGDIKKIKRHRLSRGWKVKTGNDVYITDRVVWKSNTEGYICVIHLIDTSTWETEQLQDKKIHRRQHIIWFALGIAVATGFLWWYGHI